MKLQVAIDRLSLEDALNLAKKLDGIADIIEFGTSLVKDYGLLAIKAKQLDLQKSKLLLDIKTNDEGVYEFEKGFDAGANILTVMGMSGRATLDKVYAVAEKKKRMMLIDLMNMNNMEIKSISKGYPHAIYNLHNSKDAGVTKNAPELVSKFRKTFPNIKLVAVAGGLDLEESQELAHQGETDLIIVGGKIIKTDNPVQTAKKFKEAITL